MIAQFERSETTKHLYFSLNSSFNLAVPPFRPAFRIAGLYAIYKEDTCYYAGQSKNLPSRISTNLSGKYAECDSVKVYFAGQEGFDDFYENSLTVTDNPYYWYLSTDKKVRDFSEEFILSMGVNNG